MVALDTFIPRFTSLPGTRAVAIHTHGAAPLVHDPESLLSSLDGETVSSLLKGPLDLPVSIIHVEGRRCTIMICNEDPVVLVLALERAPRGALADLVEAFRNHVLVST